MIPNKGAVALVLLALVLILGACSTETEELYRFPLDSVPQGSLADHATLDVNVVYEGSGSLRLKADEPMVFTILEVSEPDIEDATLIYQAALRTQGLADGAYLEMWCVFNSMGEYFTRGLEHPVSGDSDWTVVATPFFLKQGQNPDLLRLNLVVNGPGTVWIDDIRLFRSPLQE